ncbi:DUF488 family protein [Gracilibacillus sp. S3-1-1]|uniref:DUF488 family protein n=1 Tax=Gracilibacillus pellucidus TaxID=3095368 RepID=A0ACC6M8X8_9BACI|nr:DUF488 family protein [Gracilibacillus sp. S3-1-1]MDX8047409.1 DUF488 family protein [Gracilibacillus sp. S3-1-1]
MQIKRVYEDVQKEDGFRILVDRLWPRGISKERAQIDVWLKEIGPSPTLRKWFAHDPMKFDRFRELYIEELELDLEKKEALAQLQLYNEKYKSHISLIYAAKDEKYNHVNVLRELI